MKIFSLIVLSCLLLFGCNEHNQIIGPQSSKSSDDAGTIHNKLLDETFDNMKLALSQTTNPTALDIMHIANTSMMQSVTSHSSLTTTSYTELVTYFDNNLPVTANSNDLVNNLENYVLKNTACFDTKEYSLLIELIDVIKTSESDNEFINRLQELKIEAIDNGDDCHTTYYNSLLIGLSSYSYWENNTDLYINLIESYGFNPSPPASIRICVGGDIAGAIVGGGISWWNGDDAEDTWINIIGGAVAGSGGWIITVTAGFATYILHEYN